MKTKLKIKTGLYPQLADFAPPHLVNGRISFQPASTMGHVVLLEKAGSPFISGTNGPLKVKDVLAAAFILSQDNKARVRELIANGAFDDTVELWGESLPAGALAGVIARVVETIPNPFADSSNSAKSDK